MIVAILQARMSSTRLPGKVMKPLLGQPMIGRQIERLRRARSLDRLIVATSVEPEDDRLADYVSSLGDAGNLVPTVFRGSLGDVLDRFHAAATWAEATTVVRLTADCPLADWPMIDACVALHRSSGADHTSNGVKRSAPVGLDVEVMTRAALDTAWGEATDPYDREHVTPFLYRQPDRFRLAYLDWQPNLPHRRWTVDTPADFAFVEQVYAALYPGNPDFGIAEIEAFEQTRLRGEQPA